MANKISTDDFKKLPFQEDSNGNKLYKTPIKDFPEQYYNYNIDKLIEKIIELNTIIEVQNSQIKSLQTTLNAILEDMRTYCENKIDQEFSDYESEYAKISELESLLEDTFVKK